MRVLCGYFFVIIYTTNNTIFCKPFQHMSSYITTTSEVN